MSVLYNLIVCHYIVRLIGYRMGLWLGWEGEMCCCGEYRLIYNSLENFRIIRKAYTLGYPTFLPSCHVRNNLNYRCFPAFLHALHSISKREID